MLVTTDRPSPKSSGIKSEVGFTIDPRNLAHVVSLLRDAYSDPITAVLREYSVNAADAHVEAGIPDKPFEVTLPGRLDPVLKIRDFGRGLTPEQIEGLFCSYGASSKRQSNDYTGCLGIGCKSAFAVTDSFTVTTYHGGRERTYSCYLDESEVGKAALLSDKSSTETGLLISIPIKKEDVGEVSDKALDVFRYFKTKPVFINLGKQDQDKITRPSYLFRSATAGIKGNTVSWRNHDDNCIVMGNIAYPIKVNEIDSEKLRNILQHTSFDFEVPIGTVDIAPSREELKYNPRTKAAIKAAVKAGLRGIGEQAVKEIGDTNNLFAAIKIYKAVFMRHQLDGYLRGLSLLPSYKGKELTSCQIKLYDKDEEAKQHQFCVRKLRKLSSARRGKSYDFPEVKDMEIGLTDRLYLDTTSNQAEFYGRVRTLLSEPGFDSAYIFKARNGGFDYLKQKCPLLNEMTFEDFATLEITPPEKADPGVQGVVDNVKHSMSVFRLKDDKAIQQYRRYQSEYWEPAKVDLKTDSGVYFTIEHFKVNGAPISSRSSIIQLIRKYGYTGPIYGFKPNIVERLDKTKNTNWVKFNDKFREVWTARTAPYREAYDNFTNYNKHVCQRCVCVLRHTIEESPFTEGTVAHLYKTSLKKCSAVPSGVDLYKEIKNLEDAQATSLVEEPDPTIDLDGLSKLFFQRYPMAKFFNSDRYFDQGQSMAKDKEESKTNRKLLAEYIDFVDMHDPAICKLNKKGE